MDILNILIEHENYYAKPYLDSKGIITVGIGTASTKGLFEYEKEVLGINNIDEITYLDLKTAKWLANNEINYIIKRLEKYKWYKIAPNYIQIAVQDLCYNLGVSGFLKFKKTISYLEKQDYQMAGTELLDSSYLTDVKGRAIRISILIQTGKLLDIEKCREMYKILEKRL